jgi:hypothetical protein
MVFNQLNQGKLVPKECKKIFRTRKRSNVYQHCSKILEFSKYKDLTVLIRLDSKNFYMNNYTNHWLILIV